MSLSSEIQKYKDTESREDQMEQIMKGLKKNLEDSESHIQMLTKQNEKNIQMLSDQDDKLNQLIV